MPVHSVLKLVRLDKIFQIVDGRLPDLPFDRDLPRSYSKALGIPVRVILVRAELVEIVVRGGVLERREVFIGVERACGRAFPLRILRRRFGAQNPKDGS